MKKNKINFPKVKIDLYKLKNYQDLKKTYYLFNSELKKYFVNKNPNKKYFEKTNCPLCNSTKHFKILSIDFFNYNECIKCKSVFNSPRLKDNIYKSIYEIGPYKNYVKNLTLKGEKLRYSKTEKRKFKQINIFFNKKRKKSILDIGCGTGTLLSIFSNNNWEVLGLEPSEYSSKIAKKKYNLNIKKMFFEDYESNKKFDCITLFGVLEHLTSPLKVLKKSSKYLNRGGLLVFEVPSADSFIMNYLKKGYKTDKIFRFIESARHLLFFSSQIIKIICKKYNFSIYFIETNGLDIQTILNDKENSNIKTILNMQDLLNESMLADHYRVFLKKN